VYVRRVNIAGNTRTRDEVIRREMRQYEAAWFDSDKVRLSRDRIDRLGFFESVTIDTPAVPTAPDQVDVNINVKERATGNIQFGAGYSSTEGLVLTAGLSQQNLFGSGNALSLEVNTSRANRVHRVSHTDPYVTADGISRSVELFDRTSDLAELGLASVGFSTRGGGVVYGVPFTEFDRVFFGLRFERTKIDLTPFSPQRYVEYVDAFGETSDGLALTSRLVARQSRQPAGAAAWQLPARVRRSRTAGARPAVLPPELPVPAVLAAVQPHDARVQREIGYGDGYRATRTRSSRTSTSAASAACAATTAAASARVTCPTIRLAATAGSTRHSRRWFRCPGRTARCAALAFLDMGQVWGQNVLCPDGSGNPGTRRATTSGIDLREPAGELQRPALLDGHRRSVDIAARSAQALLCLSAERQARRPDPALPVPDRNGILMWQNSRLRRRHGR
jgi:hypothetical protein